MMRFIELITIFLFSPFGISVSAMVVTTIVVNLTDIVPVAFVCFFGTMGLMLWLSMTKFNHYYTSYEHQIEYPETLDWVEVIEWDYLTL